MKSAAKKAPPVSLEDRLAFGNIPVDEVRVLKGNISKTKFYQDVRAGLVTIRKIGTKSVVPGPVAKAYITGETEAA